MPALFSFPNESIAGIFWGALLVINCGVFLGNTKRFARLIAAIAGSIILILLLKSESRAGWFGTCSGIAWILYCQLSGHRKKQFILACFVFLPLFFFALLFYKSGSSEGRSHIYRVSTRILSDNWPAGVGLSRFKAVFNEYQANYFASAGLDNRRALLADNTFYAFNDYLQLIIETGITGVILLVCIAIFLFRRFRSLLKTAGSKTLAITIGAGLISIAVAALFSYPLQTWPLKALTLIFIGLLLFPRFIVPGFREKRTAGLITARTVFCLLLTWLIAGGIRDIKRGALETTAFRLSQSAFKTKALMEYQRLCSGFPEAGYNYYAFAEQLYYAKRLNESLAALEKCRQHYVDNRVYLLKGKTEQELGLTDNAEASFLRAVYMVPNRMESRYTLAHFYYETGDIAKAKRWCNSILNMTIKVPSVITALLLKETVVLFNKINSPHTSK